MSWGTASLAMLMGRRALLVDEVPDGLVTSKGPFRWASWSACPATVKVHLDGRDARKLVKGSFRRTGRLLSPQTPAFDPSLQGGQFNRLTQSGEQLVLPFQRTADRAT